MALSVLISPERPRSVPLGDYDKKPPTIFGIFDEREYAREVSGISVFRALSVCRIQDEITSKLCDREFVPINRKRALFTGVSKLPFCVSALFFCQISL